jgi:hypothetical protein
MLEQKSRFAYKQAAFSIGWEKNQCLGTIQK